MPLGRLGVREIGLRLVRTLVGQIRKKGVNRKHVSRSGNYCPDPEA